MIVHTLPFLLRDQNDLTMADNCFASLQKTEDTCVILFNQGYMNNTELSAYLSNYRIKFVVLGSGQNVGIPAARQQCMEYIWENIPECRFISEIHVDMIFPASWHLPLVKYLETNDEPMVCPGIITQFGAICPPSQVVQSPEMPAVPEAIIALCEKLKDDKVCEGFVHPVVHKSDVLKRIGGYDTRLLKGQQGYEDDSILLGYRYYMGTRTDWKPKICMASYVYHATLAQRMSVCNSSEEFMVNFNGLCKQYGVYGLLQLAEIHGNNHFLTLANMVIEN